VASLVPVTHTPPALALLGPDDGTLVGALMAVDRLIVATGLLVLLGGAGFVAVARLPTPAWQLTRRVEGRAFWLLRGVWWATMLATLGGLLLHGPFTAGLPLSRALDPTLLAQTVGTRFGGIWALRVLLLLLLVAVLRAWARWEAGWMRTSAWVAVGVVVAALVVTPALSGHAAAGPEPVVGAVVGVLHFSAAAVWFGGVVLLGTCMLPRPDVAMLQAVSRFSSVAFMAMVGIVVTGMMQSWRQVGEPAGPGAHRLRSPAGGQGGGVPAADRGRRPQPGAGPANADGKGLGRRESSRPTGKRH
jgi:copper transport protein